MEAHAICHVLIIFVAILLPGQPFLRCLLHEEDLVWVVRFFNNTSEVHGVINFVLGFKDFLEAEIVMALLKCVKCDVLIVPVEYVAVLTERVLHTLYWPATTATTL